MYTVMGGLSGWFGSVVLEYVDSSWLLSLAGSLVLLIGATVIYRPKTAACKGRDQVQAPTRHTRAHMITLGLSTSMVPCLPLSAVLFYAAATGSFITGCLLALMFANVASAGDAPATMRLDFFHSGNSDTEMFSLDQLVLEPLPWTGNMQQPLDKTLRGKYLFEIVDAESGAAD